MRSKFVRVTRRGSSRTTLFRKARQAVAATGCFLCPTDECVHNVFGRVSEGDKLGSASQCCPPAVSPIPVISTLALEGHSPLRSLENLSVTIDNSPFCRKVAQCKSLRGSVRHIWSHKSYKIEAPASSSCVSLAASDAGRHLAVWCQHYLPKHLFLWLLRLNSPIRPIELGRMTPLLPLSASRSRSLALQDEVYSGVDHDPHAPLVLAQVDPFVHVVNFFGTAAVIWMWTPHGRLVAVDLWTVNYVHSF
ncbi:hypothetical protein CLF_106335 [Clonorchis sinensis]|uniref:Uncharacterized protein n=1 Tax=Clonorchis sinensis TaxID=79923 RepID=G7YPX0_CLOSI|nr:hypothetical protein CLF_106335 [Clonorchis sinensis]